MTAVSCNGQPVDAGLLDAALVNYGHFTSLQVRGGAVQGWALHLRRLQQGTRELFDAELDEARLLGWLRQALQRSGMTDASLRITVFSRAFDFRQPLRAVPVDVLVSVAAPATVPGQARAVLPVCYQRELPQLKHTGTLPLFQQRRLAMRRGFDDALFVDAQGRLSEGSLWNIGFVSGEHIVWPRASMLGGVAQRLIERGAGANGLACETREIAVRDLAAFEAAFICNSATPACAVAAVDGHAFSPAEAMIARLIDAWRSNPCQTILAADFAPAKRS